MKGELHCKDVDINNEYSANNAPPPPPLLPSLETPPFGNSSLISRSPYGKMVVDRSDIPLLSYELEIQKMINKADSWGLLSMKHPSLVIYTQIPPIIQRGPQCGLVALSMASHIFPPFVSVRELKEEAKKMGISNHGEMFSSSDFADLAYNKLELSANVRKDILRHPKILIQSLLEGKLILVPYDSERNHTPCINMGHTAHWGLICGGVLQFKLASSIPSWAKQDKEIKNLWYFNPYLKGNKNSFCDDVPSLEKLTSTLSQHKLIVLWRQGKSRNLIMSHLSNLRESNAQLEEYPESKEEEYVIKSVIEGLCDQAIVLSRKDNV